MEHRRLGRSGLKVSVLSFGSWVSFGPQLDVGMARDCIEAAHDARRELLRQRRGLRRRRVRADHGRGDRSSSGWARETYVVSTKVFWGLTEGVNSRNTLNRKYLLHSIDGCLERFGLDFVDLLFCHRPDPQTPIEETVWAMSDIIDRGQGPLLGHVGVVGRRDPGRVGDRRPPPPAQAGDGAAAVQHLRAPAGRARVRPPLRGHRARPHDLEPARLGPAHAASTSTASRRGAGPRCRATSGSRTCSPTRRRNAKVKALAGDRRRARLHAVAAGAGLVRQEPQRVDGDHRRQPGRAGAGEHGRARRAAQAHRRRHGPHQADRSLGALSRSRGRRRRCGRP